MSVADILQEMARNAGRAPLARGALIASSIAGAAAVPGQIFADRERVRQQQLQEARQNEQLGFQRNADTRATADQAAQDAAVQLEAKKRAVMKLGVAAGFGDSSDPKDFDVARAAKAVTAAGFPELGKTIADYHTNVLLPKLTEFDPTKGSQDAAGNVVRKPEAKVMTPAEQAQRVETERHNKAMEGIGGQTADRAAATAKETERHNRAAEGISRLTVGRAEAAQQETARHNKALEEKAAKEKAATGAQNKVLGFFNRAKQADDDLQTVAPEINALGYVGQERLKRAPNVLQTDAGQKYNQAQRAFTEARLRKDSGAAIPDSEFENDRQTYFEQPGDGPALKAQKARARAAVLASLAFEAGPALHGFYGEDAGTMLEGYRRTAKADTAAAPADGQPGVVNGVPAVWKTVNGKAGWYAK